MFLHLLAHEAQVADIPRIPEPDADPGHDVRVCRDRANLGEDGGPAALRLHAAEVRLHARSLRARTVAVRHLPETVSERLRADLDRLEEDVVLRIASHVGLVQRTG